MKLVILAVCAVFFSVIYAFTPSSVDAASRTRGYFRSNGTYIQPYYRSNSDGYKWNNYSSRGNYNPYTGRKGYTRW